MLRHAHHKPGKRRLLLRRAPRALEGGPSERQYLLGVDREDSEWGRRTTRGVLPRAYWKVALPIASTISAVRAIKGGKEHHKSALPRCVEPRPFGTASLFYGLRLLFAKEHGGHNRNS